MAKAQDSKKDLKKKPQKIHQRKKAGKAGKEKNKQLMHRPASGAAWHFSCLITCHNLGATLPTRARGSPDAMTAGSLLMPSDQSASAPLLFHNIAVPDLRGPRPRHRRFDPEPDDDFLVGVFFYHADFRMSSGDVKFDCAPVMPRTPMKYTISAFGLIDTQADVPIPLVSSVAKGTDGVVEAIVGEEARTSCWGESGMIDAVQAARQPVGKFFYAVGYMIFA